MKLFKTVAIIIIITLSFWACNNEEKLDVKHEESEIIKNSSQNPFQNYGRAHNALMEMIMSSAINELSEDSNIDEILHYVSNEVRNIMNNDDFLLEYNIESNNEALNIILNEYESNSSLFGIEGCKGCIDFEKLILMLPTFPEYEDIFFTILNSNDPEDAISKLNILEKGTLLTEDSDVKDGRLFIISIGKNSIELADRHMQNGTIACCNWREVGASDCGGALAGVGAVGVGAFGGAALFSGTALIGQLFGW